ncbi:Hsp20/alpha crystallin family protein [Solirubrobacter soli]|uniref:Hsp20/alpha crystallin family protein n=1 Tax=Solirubrobacter soli TaxID=363832 RepID=UPI001B7FBECD|nr:Hsp20/alpha crystallin family protein [Solirubrobacter soli]
MTEAAYAPKVDVAVGESDVLLTFDVPGLTAEDLTIEVVDGYLVLGGERQRPSLPEGSGIVHGERPYGSFARRIKMPDSVDVDGVAASLDNGVLSLIVPKSERAKRKTISIASGNERATLETTAA